VTAPRRVLVVEDDLEMRAWLDEELRELGYDVRTAADGTGALGELERAGADVVVTDLMMPGMKGTDLLAEVRARHAGLPVVIITAFGSIESAVDAMQAGAFHYVAKPFRIEQLRSALERALVQRAFAHDLALERPLGAAAELGIVACSEPMRRALELTARAANADAPVLLLGESGTGKERLARLLHASGPRRDAPFVAVNCAAIPEHLLESQLFGHRRGAFTDAREDHRGLFQSADGGTLLLDEIGDMPALLQAKLLRVIQEREVHPLGASAPVAVDVRIVAATHADLARAVEQGRFRRDLFYRLNVIPIAIPPLRERPDDVPPLVAHFIEKNARVPAGHTLAIEPAAMEALRRHDWPGNVRELENVIERAIVLRQGDTIGLADLPPELRGRPVAVELERPASAASLAGIEREHILRTLHAAGGNRAAAARLLGVDRKTLYRKLKLYGLA